jgi:hypothetical protein
MVQVRETAWLTDQPIHVFIAWEGEVLRGWGEGTDGYPNSVTLRLGIGSVSDGYDGAITYL